MYPIKLSIKDFGAHADTEFSFEDFSSALIIGRVKENERFSNGSGKSTIFNAIEYVLFNEVKFSSLEKTIRDGCDICKVSLEFVSSLDKSLYKITRSNSRKTGTDARLYRKENDTWIDLTQRRVTDTEKEIVKIVGFNYKSFCASVLFSQAGSENNIQKDFGNLPALTPEKRKSVLREVLQLNIYNSYEKLARNKYSLISSTLDKNRTILSMLGDPNNKRILLIEQDEEIKLKLFNFNEKFVHIKEKLLTLKNEYRSLYESYNGIQFELEANSSKISSCKEQIARYENSIKELKDKIYKNPKNKDSLKSKLDAYQYDLLDKKKYIVDNSLLKTKISSIRDSIYESKNTISNIDKKIYQINNPISTNTICDKCHQNISEDHRLKWKINIENEVVKYNDEKTIVIKKLNSSIDELKNVENEINKSVILDKQISDIESSIKLISKDLENQDLLNYNYLNLVNEHELLVKEKKVEFQELNKKSLTFSHIDLKSLRDNLSQMSFEIKNITEKELIYSKQINILIGEQAITKHKIEQCNTDEDKINILNSQLMELEKSLLIYSKVIQAFGSGGIPSLITHTILDELQEEANQWLFKLRPGLQLQFIVINDKSDKEKEDTLDISYFIDGNQREYKQLSGAQKIVVSLSIKLGLLSIMNKRLGINIKLILLDEVDQALDEGSTEIFSNIIKVIQNDFKILVVTHNDALKHKFSHAIIVDQDENNVSRGKLINW